MTDSVYITTTGEGWEIYENHDGICIEAGENKAPVYSEQLLAELRALRAQRERLAYQGGSMTGSVYITTTGERWHEGAPFNEGWIPTLLRDESENDDDCTIVRPSDILAELRALRAQRDELLAALEEIHATWWDVSVHEAQRAENAIKRAKREA